MSIRARITLFITLLLTSITTFAQQRAVTYLGGPHLRAEEGTIECWIRLDVEPSPEQARSFPLWTIFRDGEENPVMRFTYQIYWHDENFHFFLASWGPLLGKSVGNGFIATVEDTQLTAKADAAGVKYPRTPRLKKGDWHHIALTWQGLPRSTIAFYLDGECKILPRELEVGIWNDLEKFSLVFSAGTSETLTIDDLRISSVARSPQEMKDSASSPAPKADRYTLLLDRFESLEQRDGKTFCVPEIFTADGASLGVKVDPALASQVEGRSGGD
jgi:hypothetical protein